MRAAVLSAAVALAVISPMAVPAAAAAPAPAAPVAGSDLGSATSTVVGTFTDASGGAGTFTGTFTPSRFATSGDEITVDGLLAGQLVDSQGQSQAVSQEQTFAVQQIAPGVSCDILDLDLGPLDLDLLGLTVNLNEVLLNIAAVPGAGNLLGNLLCAVTGLLDGVGTIVQIVALLNQILALLGLLAG
jgi:hypothetical protein